MSNRNRALVRLNNLNAEFDRIIKEVERIDDSELLKKPSDKEWSVIQILNHLYEVEQTSLDYILYKEKENAKFSKESLMTKLRFFGYKIALWSPLRFKVPTVLSQPLNEGNLDYVISKFSKIRGEFHAFVERQDNDFFNTASYKHTVVGRIKNEKMFVFFKSHLKHHEKQILRTLIKISKQ